MKKRTIIFGAISIIVIIAACLGLYLLYINYSYLHYDVYSVEEKSALEKYAYNTVCVIRGGKTDPSSRYCELPFSDAGMPCRIGDKCAGSCVVTKPDMSALYETVRSNPTSLPAGLENCRAFVDSVLIYYECPTDTVVIGECSKFSTQFDYVWTINNNKIYSPFSFGY